MHCVNCLLVLHTLRKWLFGEAHINQIKTLHSSKNIHCIKNLCTFVVLKVVAGSKYFADTTFKYKMQELRIFKSFVC